MGIAKGGGYMNGKYILEYVRHCNDEMREFRDNETGVHYFVVAKSSYDGGISICPRYKADGTLYVD